MQQEERKVTFFKLSLDELLERGFVEAVEDEEGKRVIVLTEKGREYQRTVA